MSLHDIEAKVEQAFGELLTDVASELSLEVFQAISFEQFLNTAARGEGLFVSCPEANPMPNLDGNWRANVVIGSFTDTRSHATGTLALEKHRERTSSVREIVLTEDLADQLNRLEVEDFTALGFIIGRLRTFRVGLHIISAVEIQLDVTGSLVPETAPE